jgi:hypothetical protein
MTTTDDEVRRLQHGLRVLHNLTFRIIDSKPEMKNMLVRQLEFYERQIINGDFVDPWCEQELIEWEKQNAKDPRRPLFEHGHKASAAGDSKAAK